MYLLTALGEKELIKWLEENLTDFDDPDGWISHAEAVASIGDILTEQGISEVVIDIGAHESISGNAERYIISSKYFKEVHNFIAESKNGTTY